MNGAGLVREFNEITQVTTQLTGLGVPAGERVLHPCPPRRQWAREGQPEFHAAPANPASPQSFRGDIDSVVK